MDFQVSYREILLKNLEISAQEKGKKVQQPQQIRFLALVVIARVHITSACQEHYGKHETCASRLVLNVG
jgi:hypothetical protein